MGAASISKYSPQEFIDANGIGRRQWLILSIIFLILLADGMDVTIVSHVFPSLMREWGTSIGEITLVVTGGFVGMGVGAMVAGRLADRWGRKNVTIAAMILLSVTTVAVGTAPNIEMFAFWRIVSSVGLGGAMPVAITLVADLVPAARRGQMMAIVYAGVGLGTTVGAFLAGAVIPAAGWRSLMIVCGLIPLIIVVPFVIIVPESPTLLAVRGAMDKARKALARLAPGRDISGVDVAPAPEARGGSEPGAFGVIVSRRFAITTALLWPFAFIGLGVQLLVAQYLPTLLQAPVPGLDTVQSSLVVGMYGAAGVIGSFVLGALLKRFSRFLVIMVLLIGSLVGLLVIGLFPSLEFAALLVGISLLGLVLPPSIGGTKDILSAVAYPARVRGTGVGAANFAARVGTVAGGIGGGTLIGAGLGLSGLFLVLMIPITILIALLGGLRIDARRRGADGLEGEREEDSHTVGRAPAVPATGGDRV